jgi:hypothetical protein
MYSLGELAKRLRIKSFEFGPMLYWICIEYIRTQV